jgi:hypothetical protein
MLTLSDDEVAKLSRDLVDDVTDMFYDKWEPGTDLGRIYEQIEEQLLDAVTNELRLVKVAE